MLEIDISKIVVHEADEPDAIIDFLDAEALAGEHGRDADLFAMHADAPANCDEDVAIVDRVGEIGDAARVGKHRWCKLRITAA